MRPILLLLSLFSLRGAAQQLPKVNFNHFYLVIDSSDLSAMQHSAFMKNEFAATITRTTKAENGITWKGTYLQGVDNYFEIFDSNGVGEPSGNAGVGLSVDGIGELKTLDNALSKKYQTEINLREKQFADKKVAWFSALGIRDSLFDSLSHFSFWVMEYKEEYFDYNHFKKENNKLTRVNYLHQFEKERKNKILKRFTGITFNASEAEQTVFANFLLSCGYKKANGNSFISPENFKISFIARKTDDRLSIAFVEFESNTSRTGTVKISDNIQIRFMKQTGKLIFK